MPSVKSVQNIVAYSDQNHIVFKGSKLSVGVVHNMVSMTPVRIFTFYVFTFQNMRIHKFIQYKSKRVYYFVNERRV